jgi:tetratricopeptide (TPR) repeat protein
LLWMDRDYTGALEKYEKLNREYPDNAHDIYWSMAGCQRRLGRWKEARENHEKSIEVDPTNLDHRFEFVRFLLGMREYGRADEHARLLRGRKYEQVRELVRFNITANAQELTTEFNHAIADLYNRRFDAILLSLDTTKAEIRETNTAYFPKALDRAQIYFLKKEKAKAEMYAREAIKILTVKVKETPDDERVYLAVAFAHAYAGMKEEAVQFAIKATEIMPMQSDAFLLGPWAQFNLARIYALCGKYDLAMDKIEWLLTVPGQYSKATLRTDPEFDLLRPLPRFQKILNTEYTIQM